MLFNDFLIKKIFLSVKYFHINKIFLVGSSAAYLRGSDPICQHWWMSGGLSFTGFRDMVFFSGFRDVGVYALDLGMLVS
jgi:hypothetical protein